jgi:Bacterial Ig-like domain (group 1)
VTISGASTLVLTQQTTLSILLRNSGGNPIPNELITLSSTRGNTLSATTQTTDFNGSASITVRAVVGGTDTIQATALGASGTLTLTVSSANFVFNEPAPGIGVRLETEQEEVFMQDVEVRLEVAGVPTPDAQINFTATRGVFVDPASDTCEGETATNVRTGPSNNAPGIARVTICSTDVGSAVITASCPDPNPLTADPCDDAPTTQIAIEFVATNPTSLILQASPTTLSVNAGGSTDQQSIITAIVRDAVGNLVKNQTVNFALADVSGGSIFPASAITDSFGRASTVYTAGTVSSAQDGVLIKAQVSGTGACDPTVAVPTGPCDQVTLTVAQQSLFITLGTGNDIQETTMT